MSSIEKFKIDEGIRIAFLKHGGDILLVAKETGYDFSYIKKVVQKIKKKQKRDVARLVANDIARLVLSGSEQRERVYLKCLNSLEEKEGPIEVSACHKVPVRSLDFGGDIFYECPQCDHACSVITISANESYDIKIKLLSELREESKFLVDFADKLGFTNKETIPNNKITQYNMIVNQGNTNTNVELNEKDKRIIVEAAELSGPERQQMRRTLEKEIIDVNFKELDDDV